MSRPTIYGVLMTRDEVDLLRLNIVHHLQTSCDRIIVVDNGSQDGTRSVLKRLASKLPVDWTTESGTLEQGAVVTEMLHEARKQGADWVIPLDTDEFWHTGRKLHEILAEDSGSGALEVRRVELIQARDQKKSNARGVLRMTMRVAEPVRGVEAIDEYLAGERSMFETEPQPKVLLRATEGVVVPRGSHTAEGLAGPITVSSEIAIFHAPLRSHQAVNMRMREGARLSAQSEDPYESIQSRYWERMSREDRMLEAWAAHSYADGALDVAGRRVELVEDHRLVELLGPWVRSARAQVLARYTGRSW
ncbi:MAG: glycosyltransferase family 2 protein [Thermoleophilaceae bacterium]|nr:glycosyltransferase family 2 protein [Thermoleophilaceae bacterium]